MVELKCFLLLLYSAGEGVGCVGVGGCSESVLNCEMEKGFFEEGINGDLFCHFEIV